MITSTVVVQPIEWDDGKFGVHRGFVRDEKKKRNRYVALVEYDKREWKLTVASPWCTLHHIGPDLMRVKQAAPGLLAQVLATVLA